MQQLVAKKIVRECRGFCKRWQHKWFLSIGSSWDYAGEIMNWLGFVVDSVTGGSKNCFSLPVLRGTLRGKIMEWLGVVVDSARNVSWATKLVFGIVSCVGQACLS